MPLLEDCQREFGDVFALRGFGGRTAVVVSDPALIKEVLAADPATLKAGVGNATLLEPMLGKRSLLTLDGAEHLRQRRLLLPAFHGERMQSYVATMREVTLQAIAEWPVDRPFSLQASMQAITLDVILETVFGVDRHERDTRLRETLVELLDLLSNPWFLIPGMMGINPFRIEWLRMSRLKRVVDDALYEIIARRRTSPGGMDVLGMMLTARDEQGEPMTDVEVRDELITLLMAGHDTTATALAWAFDRVVAHPVVLARLRDELAEGREELLDAVIRETLRVRPIVPVVGRYVARPFTLGRWELPVGVSIAPSIFLAGRRADAYPDPNRFDPDRWLGVKPDPTTWLPFGGGIRRCIGMAFAQVEMRTVLSTVLSRADLRLVDGPARVVRRGITFAPRAGRPVALARRPSPGHEAQQ